MTKRVVLVSIPRFSYPVKSMRPFSKLLNYQIPYKFNMAYKMAAKPLK